MVERISLRVVSAVTFLFLVIALALVFQGCGGQKIQQGIVADEFSHLTPSIEEQLFLVKLRQKIGSGNDFGNTIMLVVGPFSSFEDIRVDGEIVPIDPDFRSLAYLIYKDGNFYITFDHSFYNKLSVQERLFVIAHETWHAKKYYRPNPEVSNPILSQISMEELRSEVESDFFAAKYVDPEVIKNFLYKYCHDKNELRWRIWALYELQQEKRG